ncbi:hypothetical protein QQF64_011617 [Cirrhinus molitorella]|uniref:THAP domain-containing protein 1 n=1 Tax=Cirrhinus molitorella TaxID=172907 RepID=A0ABR3LZU8_9TELE
MVRSCVYPGCGKLLKPKRLRPQGDVLTSHKFPLPNPERLRLWLLALCMDINTPEDSLIHKRVCGDHFYDDDFHHSDKGHRRLLKASAVPMPCLKPAEFGKKSEFLATRSEADLEVQGAEVEVFLANSPQSTPVKHTTRQFTEAHSKLLVLRNPETAQKGTNTSTSGTYYAYPPIRSHQSPPMYIKPEPTEEEYEENVKPDVGMLSIDTPLNKDISFQPPNSTSSTEDEECEMLQKTTKWIVNEPNVMELFKRCQECGSLITETRKIAVGSLLCVQWKCEKTHKGQWSSCTDVGGMPANNLLVSACSLFTGGLYAQPPITQGNYLPCNSVFLPYRIITRTTESSN